MTKVSTVKRAQKSSVLLRAISTLLLEAARDNAALSGLSITRVELSPDKGSVSVFFYTDKGFAKFKEVLHELKLYKPSLRASLARSIPGRYTPDITFKFDETFEKTQRLEHLLDTIKKSDVVLTDLDDDDQDEDLD